MQTCLEQPIPNWDYSSHWSAGSTFPFHLVHPFSSRRTKYTQYTYIYIPYPLLVKHAVLEAGGSVHFGCAYNILTLKSRVRLGCPLAARNKISHKIIADLQHDHENSAPQRCAKCTHQSFKTHLWTVQMPRGGGKVTKVTKVTGPNKTLPQFGLLFSGATNELSRGTMWRWEIPLPFRFFVKHATMFNIWSRL